jgi:predicted kinase
MKLHDILSEGIYDKGIFKCLFLGGIPASGKSTIVKDIIQELTVSHSIKPRVLDYDKFYEYLSKKHDVPISTSAEVEAPGAVSIQNRTKELMSSQLELYLTSMLPVIIDTTASNVHSTIVRMRRLRQYGYDVMMLYKESELERSLTRAESRRRFVPPEYIKDTHESKPRTIEKMQKVFNNAHYPLQILGVDEEVATVMPAIVQFFTSPIRNPIGLQQVDSLKSAERKYIIRGQTPPVDWYGKY